MRGLVDSDRLWLFNDKGFSKGLFHPYELGLTLKAADVLVFRDGDEAVAIDKRGREIARGTDHAEVWGSAIGSGRRVAVFGEFTFTKKVYRENLENTEVLGRAKIKILGDGYPAIHLVDPVNVKIRGLEIDGEGQSSSDPTNSGIIIETVDRVVENIEIKDCEIYDVVRAGILFIVTLTKSSSTNTYGFRNIKIRDNYIHDLMKGDYGIDGNGIWVGRGHTKGVVIEGNYIEEVLSAGIGVGSDPNFGFHENAVVKNNTIINAYYFGIDCAGMLGGEIRGNYIYNDDAVIGAKATHTPIPIYFESAESVKLSRDVTIRGNYIDGANVIAIDIYRDNERFRIIGNTIRRVKNPNQGGGRHIVPPPKSIVEGNIIDGSEDGDLVDGITPLSDCIVKDNYIINATNHAIEVGERTNVKIIGNHILNPARHGIFIISSTGCIVIGNYIEGIRSGYYGIYEKDDSDYNIIKNNVLRNISGTPVHTVGANTIEADNVVI